MAGAHPQILNLERDLYSIVLAGGQSICSGPQKPTLHTAAAGLGIWIQKTKPLFIAKEFIRKDRQKELLYYVKLIRAC